MKRQFFGALLMGAMVVGATTTLQSCKDYDDDIQNLQQQIDANSKAIKAIEDLIKNGSVITNVAEADNGVIVTLSDGKKFTIANGKDGEAGTKTECLALASTSSTARRLSRSKYRKSSSCSQIEEKQ